MKLGDNVLCTRSSTLAHPLRPVAKNKRRTRVHARLADIPDSSTLNHVAHCEALDRLVLAHASRAVRAADEVNVAAALLVAAVVSSLLRLWGKVSTED